MVVVVCSSRYYWLLILFVLSSPSRSRSVCMPLQGLSRYGSINKQVHNFLKATVLLLN